MVKCSLGESWEKEKSPKCMLCFHRLLVGPWYTGGGNVLKNKLIYEESFHLKVIRILSIRNTNQQLVLEMLTFLKVKGYWRNRNTQYSLKKTEKEEQTQTHQTEKGEKARQNGICNWPAKISVVHCAASPWETHPKVWILRIHSCRTLLERQKDVLSNPA